MVKTILTPIYFAGRNQREIAEYDMQLNRLKEFYKEEAEIRTPVEFGKAISEDTDMILIPQLFGAIFGEKERLKKITLPILLLTSEFATVEMWDWEIVAWLREEVGVEIYTPYNMTMAKVIMRAVGLKKKMRQSTKFLIFQDNPGEGMQSYLFKKFYWWDKACIQQIQKSFGVQIIYKSWKEVNEHADRITDQDAEQEWKKKKVPFENLENKEILLAVKLYLAIKRIIDKEKNICGIGSNCLNESFYSKTTPCLAWNWLFEQDKIVWSCEGDIISLISQYILYQTLQMPLMMTNIYPFLSGMAALKHEKIREFPQIEDSENHALAVHCGYFGFAPQSFCSKWVMRPRVLEIVNENAVVIDCEMKLGAVTMAKFSSNMQKITIIEAEIEQYVKYPGSDCRNGALLKYTNGTGHKIMETLSSHHAVIIQGNVTYLIEKIAQVFGLTIVVM